MKLKNILFSLIIANTDYYLNYKYSFLLNFKLLAIYGIS